MLYDMLDDDEQPSYRGGSFSSMSVDLLKAMLEEDDVLVYRGLEGEGSKGPPPSLCKQEHFVVTKC